MSEYNSTGLCFCGCGKKTNVITENRPNRGLVKGEYRKYLKGHHLKVERNYRIEGSGLDSYAILTLRYSGEEFEVLLDTRDVELVKPYNWVVDKQPTNTYVRARVYNGGNPKPQCIAMHRLILSAPSNLVVDHIDRDGLNNRRHNIRICTQHQNMQNTVGYPSLRKYSSFKGVTFDKSRGKFVAQIKAGGKHYHLGRFDLETDAAKAYNRAAITLHGKYGVLNDV